MINWSPQNENTHETTEKQAEIYDPAINGFPKNSFKRRNKNVKHQPYQLKVKKENDDNKIKRIFRKHFNLKYYLS